ncbi:Exopolygalacturonase, partial [Mucuna pruriens]
MLVSILSSIEGCMLLYSIEAPGTSPNTDGITVSVSNNITISSSTIGVGNDFVSIGPGSTNIYVSFVHWSSVGSLGKRSNCTINGTMNGVRVNTWSGAPPSSASNLVFENITMINVLNPII